MFRGTRAGRRPPQGRHGGRDPRVAGTQHHNKMPPAQAPALHVGRRAAATPDPKRRVAKLRKPALPSLPRPDPRADSRLCSVHCLRPTARPEPAILACAQPHQPKALPIALARLSTDALPFPSCRCSPQARAWPHVTAAAAAAPSPTPRPRPRRRLAPAAAASPRRLSHNSLQVLSIPTLGPSWDPSDGT